jgi:hypothetical protein
VVADLAHGYREWRVLAVEYAPDVSRRGRELLVVVICVRGCRTEKQDSGCGKADGCTERRGGVHLVLRFSGPGDNHGDVPSGTEEPAI